MQIRIYMGWPGLERNVAIPSLTGPYRLVVRNEYFFNNHTRTDDYNGTVFQIIMDKKEDYSLLEMVMKSNGQECWSARTGYCEGIYHPKAVGLPDSYYRGPPKTLVETLIVPTKHPMDNVFVFRDER